MRRALQVSALLVPSAESRIQSLSCL